MRRLALAVAVLAVSLAGCGGSSGTKTVTVKDTVTVDQATPGGGAVAGFKPAVVYKKASPGVVTVVSVFPGTSLGDLLGGGGGGGGQEGVGSGFVVDAGRGEIATNAHVVTNGSGNTLKRAKTVLVQFADGNQVRADIVGVDPNVDDALLRIPTKGLHLHALPLGSSEGVVVGEPVAAIGSPFNEPQSLSTGVISATDRTIESLAGRFGISGAIQTDAAINHGNSGGPLLDAQGRVLGINSQIQSTGGGGEGVGFAVPVDAVKRSLDQLRRDGKAVYAFLGVTSVAVFPQLAQRFNLGTSSGAWVQDVTPGGPADQAGIKGGGPTSTFEAQDYKTGGDVITEVDGQKLARQSDLSELIATKKPGERVSLVVYRGGNRRTVDVTLGRRPAGSR